LPNQILLGYKLALQLEEDTPSNNEAANMQVQNVKEKRAQAIDAINQAVRSKQVMMSQYRPGEQVWLEATHLKVCHQKTKLKPKQYGPFKIIKEISPMVYQLRLPMAWRIHDVFHASLLSPYRKTTVHSPNFSQPPPELIDREEEYQVERIMGHRTMGQEKKLQYLIKWEGYPDSDNTWEPTTQIHAPNLIKQYQRQHHLSIKTLQTMVETRCTPSLKQSQSNQSFYLPTPSLSKLPPSSSNPIYNPGNSSFCGSTTNHLTTPWPIPGSAKTTLVPITIPTGSRKCQPSPLTLWLKHPLAHHPPYGPP
jgi:hypothetical protein